MKSSVKDELISHLIDMVKDGVINANNYEDAHFHAFNEDYYIIGYYNAEQWLKRHNISAFDAITTCTDYERENFGEASGKYDNSESTVNMLAYIYGEKVTPCADSWESFCEQLGVES